jgi:hypothetical protein
VGHLDGNSSCNGLAEEPPKAFSATVRNLLSIDRAGDVRGGEPPPVRFAFSDAEEPLGTGNDGIFDLFNAFCLLTCPRQKWIEFR